MTLKQLRFLHEIARHALNISAAAAALRVSQPGMSRQVQALEAELGVPLLVRRRGRLTALTEAGTAVLAAAQRLLGEADNIGHIADDARRGGGQLVVATSHLHARYTLLAPFRTLRAAYPEVQLLMLQADPDEVPRLVETGEADIGVSTSGEGGGAAPSGRIVALGGGVLRRSLILPSGHPLARQRRPSLAEIAEHPFVGYGARSRAGRLLERAFAAEGLVPRYVVRASDSDVIKAYVAQGLGIGIVPAAALAGDGWGGSPPVDVTALLPESTMLLSLRRDMYLRRHVVEFVRMVAPAWTGAAIRRAMAAPTSG